MGRVSRLIDSIYRPRSSRRPRSSGAQRPWTSQTRQITLLNTKSLGKHTTELLADQPHSRCVVAGSALGRVTGYQYDTRSGNNDSRIYSHCSRCKLGGKYQGKTAAGHVRLIFENLTNKAITTFYNACRNVSQFVRFYLNNNRPIQLNSTGQLSWVQ